jgi:hypothetical protein
MNKYAIYVPPKDIWDTIHTLDMANAKWFGWLMHDDFVDMSINIIKNCKYMDKGMVIYIHTDGGILDNTNGVEIRMQHSRPDYLDKEIDEITKDYEIVDSIYSIPLFFGFANQDELEIYDTDFFDI